MKFGFNQDCYKWQKNIENQSLLTVAKEGHEYVLLYDSQHVTTNGVNKVTHKLDHLLKAKDNFE